MEMGNEIVMKNFDVHGSRLKIWGKMTIVTWFGSLLLKSYQEIESIYIKNFNDKPKINM